MGNKDIFYFIAVAEERSFSNAAKRLNISQPSLSQYIKNMEDILGVNLFDRSVSPLKMTYAGERYFEHAKHICNIHRVLENEIHNFRDLKSGLINLGIPFTRSELILPLVLPLFYKKYPGIIVKIFESRSIYLEELLIKGDIDIAIMSMPFKYTNMQYEKLLSEEIVLISSDDDSIDLSQFVIQDKKDSVYPCIDVSRLGNQKFVLLKRHQRLRHISDMVFKENSINPEIILEVGNIFTAINLVEHGLGLTVTADTFLNLRKNESKVNMFSISGEFSKWNLAVAYRDVKNISFASKAFIETLFEVI